MSRANILADLKNILEEVLELKNLDVTEETTAGDIPQWDSVMHVEIIVSIEDKYDVKFSIAEILNFQKLGDMVDEVLSKVTVKQ